MIARLERERMMLKKTGLIMWFRVCIHEMRYLSSRVKSVVKQTDIPKTIIGKALADKEINKKYL